MSTFTLATSYLTTSNLPWFMDLTFQVPMQHCSLQHCTLLLSPVTSTTGYCVLLWLHPFILSGVISPLISGNILGTYWPGEFLFQYSIILPFHTVHGVLKARILKWFAIPFSSGPHSVRWVALISHTNKVMLKILQVRLQQYVNHEFPDVQASFRKGRGTRDQIANIHWIMEKAREFQKNIYFCFIDCAKSLTVWIPKNCGKFWKRWEYQTTWPASWETYMRVRKQQLALDMEQQTGSK